MKRRIPKILGVALSVMLLASLVLAAVPVSADPGNNKWEAFSIPKTGLTGSYKLATGATVVGPVDISLDGTLYVYANPATTRGIFKSTDNGYSWTKLATPTAAIVAIVCSPDDADVVYYATAANIYKSTDAGATWSTLVGAPSAHTFASLDVKKLADRYMVVIGTSSADAADVFLLDEGLAFPTLTNMGFSTYITTTYAPTTAIDNVFAVVFAPDFLTSRQIVAVGYAGDDTDVFISTKLGGAGWGGTIGDPAAAIGATTTHACIAFPSDYSSSTATGNTSMYVGINDTANAAEGVYFLQGVAAPGNSVITNIHTGVDVATIAVAGPSTAAQILVGLVGAADVDYSANSGALWSVVSKNPSGTGTDTFVAIATDFATSGMAWAAAGGNEGGVSMTSNSCSSWNQVGLVVTTITAINDLAFADSTMFMASEDATPDDSLWRHDGTNWVRVLNSVTLGAAFDMVEVAPTNPSAVFVVNCGAQQIYRSITNGETFSALSQLTGLNVTGWVVLDTGVIVTGGAAAMRKTTNSGLSWTPITTTGATGSFASYATAPGDTTNILAGTSTGQVFQSSTSGGTWAIRGAIVAAAAFPAFDADYASNSTIYHTTGAGGGVYRFVVGTSTAWATIDGQGQANEFPVDAGSGIVSSADGTLYVADVTAVVLTAGAQAGGMYRCLNPTATVSATTSNPYWEIAVDGLVAAGPKFTGLWLTDSNKVWSIDTVTPAIRHYTDNLATATTLSVDSVTTGRASFSWTDLTGATSYQLVVNTRSDFRGTGATVTYIAPEKLASAAVSAGTKYYARVRVATTAGLGAPVTSRYSDTINFTTQLAAPGTPTALAPTPGAQNVILTPSFQWGAVAGASSYELEIADNADFSDAITGTSTINAWQITESLEYSTTYYWRVTAMSATGAPASAPVVGVFTTAAESEPPVIIEPDDTSPTIILPEAATPAYIWAVIAIGAILVIAVVVLIVRTRRVP